MKKWTFASLALVAVLAMGLSLRAEEGEGGDMGGGDGGAPNGGKKEKKGGDKPAGEKKAAPQLEELTLTGKLTKTEKSMKDKNGGEKKMEVYSLECTDGAKVTIPPPKAGKGGEAPAVDLSAFADKNVELVAMGTKRSVKKGDKEVTMYSVKEVKSVKEAGGGGDAPAPGAEAPAAE